MAHQVVQVPNCATSISYLHLLGLDAGFLLIKTCFLGPTFSASNFVPLANFQVLRSENIEYVVAPYEADAQLAYLCSLEEEKGGIVSVITEDSDLIAYGCQAVRTMNL